MHVYSRFPIHYSHPTRQMLHPGRIYLDYAATAPLQPAARAAMAPWLEQEFGNPSSLHAEGRRAKEAIDSAREALSSALGCRFAEVLFTSSGTEAANLAIVGAALANTEPARNRVLLSAVEHHCVLHTRPLLERLGYSVELIPVDRLARVRMEGLTEMLGDDVLLVSAMHANNEVGTLQPASEIASLVRTVGALYHCDAVQTFGSLPWTAANLGADMITLSAHKLGGPKGAGAIYVRAGVKLKPLILGGGQEREMRAGTENVSGIVGFANAVQAALADKGANQRKHGARDAFLSLLEGVPFVETVPDRSNVLPGHAHIRFPGIDAETMLIRLDLAGISASSGAACSSGSLEPSHVLLAAGYSGKEAREGLRFTFGAQTTIQEAKTAAAIVSECALAIQSKR